MLCEGGGAGYGCFHPTCACLCVPDTSVCGSDANAPFGTPGSFRDRLQMKLLILVPFAAAIVSSVIWYEAPERHLTRAQKTAFGVTALVAWLLVIVGGIND
jgi:hypothetical protein